MTVRYLLFDCDGVLVDTEYEAAVQMTATLRELGATLKVEEYLEALSGATFSGIVEKFFPGRFGREELASLVAEVEDRVTAAVRPVAGMPALIARLSVPLAVVSNSSERTVRKSLQTAGYPASLAVRLFSAGKAARPKPHPDVYRLALQELACSPAEVLAVEDSPTGVQAARAAGLAVVGFAGGSHIRPLHLTRLRQLGVMHLARQTGELAAILQQLGVSD